MAQSSNVTIQKSWTLTEFINEFGKAKVYQGKDDEGNSFESLVFFKDHGHSNDVDFFAQKGRSVQDLSMKEIAKLNKSEGNIMMGLNSNDHYTLYKRGENAWEDFDCQ